MKKAFLVFLALIMIGSVAVAEDGGADSKAYINIGDYNETVIALHQKLADLGYYGLRPESPWSEKSESALKAVRYVLGLEEDGVIDMADEYKAVIEIDENLPQFAIKRIETIDEYLDYIREHEDFTIFIAVRDEASKSMGDSTKQKLKDLGLTTEWNSNRYRKAYVAVVSNGNVIEELAATETTGIPIKTEGVVDGINYGITSAGFENDGGSNASICVDGKEWALDRRGLKIVIELNGKVIDSVSFDTFGEEKAKARR